MPKEIELKILDVDRAQVLKRLRQLGARHLATHNYKRIVIRLSEHKEQSKYLRLRTDGKVNTITLKIGSGSGLSQTEEYEVRVEDFEATAKILCNVFKNAIYEENKREEYSLGGAIVTIDSWPFIPDLVEIEAKSEKAVEDTYGKMQISGKRFGNVPAGKVYEHYGLDFAGLAKRNDGKLRKLLGNR